MRENGGFPQKIARIGLFPLLKKDKYSGEIYVNPAKGLCVFTKCEAYTEQLALPQNMPTEFLNSQVHVTSDILGVADIRKEFCCLRCNRQVKPQKIATCNNTKCNLEQKLSNCPQHWYLRALVKNIDNNSVSVIFRHDMIMQALSAIKWQRCES
jgi:hypothetical protein